MKLLINPFENIPGDKDTKVCDTKSIECYRNAEIDIYGDVLVDGLTDNYAKLFRQQCNCMHSCMEYIYKIEIDRAKLLNSSTNGYQHLSDLPGKYGIN